MKLNLHKVNNFRIFKLLIFMIVIFGVFIIFENNVQATDENFGEYPIDENYVIRILPGTTLEEFKNKVGNQNIVVMKDESTTLSNGEFVGSGMNVQDGSKTYILSVIGDFTGDGEITITDLVKIKLHTVSIKILDDIYLKAADINNDGKITITDLVQTNLVVVKIKSIEDFLKNDNPDLYAKLYTDGTLTLSSSNTVLSDKTVSWEYSGDYAEYNGQYPEESTEKDFLTSKVPWKNHLNEIKEVKILDTISPKLTAYWFADCINLVSFSNIDNLDTSNVTNMSDMFNNCKKLERIDLSEFNTAKVTNMRGMFKDCLRLKALSLTSFDTSKVTDMEEMFKRCTDLTTINISTSFNTSNVTSMANMFEYCSSLNELDLRDFNTNNVITMKMMFYNCANLVSLNLSSFNTSKVTDMSYIFAGCKGLTGLDVSNFDTSKVTDMSYVFSGCSKLTQLDLRNFDISNVTKTGGMFSLCEKLTLIKANETRWNTSNVTNDTDMFKDCGTDHVTFEDDDPVEGIYATLYTDGTLALSSHDETITGKTVEKEYGNIVESEFTADTQPWKNDVSKITSVKIVDRIYPLNTAYWFNGCSNLTTLENANNINMIHVTDRTAMFDGCTSLETNVTSLTNSTNGLTSNISAFLASFGKSLLANMLELV